ncbi:unnamed protein product, partial [Closterium sp. NIES-53]
ISSVSAARPRRAHQSNHLSSAARLPWLHSRSLLGSRSVLAHLHPRLHIRAGSRSSVLCAALLVAHSRKYTQTDPHERASVALTRLCGHQCQPRALLLPHHRHLHHP